jgi:16S rRNA (cytidine1402-2'-O)-methyltransferase
VAGDAPEGGSGGRGTLYVVATPLGNLEDLSPRAARALGEADLIAAEDTRRVAKLLFHLGVRKPTTSFHSYSSAGKLASLVEALEGGRTVALVSDAGTPCISDPGAEIVAEAWKLGAKVVPIPGPCAAVVAISVSGLQAGRFLFAGYPPRGRGERRKFLAEMLAGPWPVVLYEAPGRAAGLLEAIAEVCGEGREVLVARELTKMHEELARRPAGDIAAAWREREIRGEVTVVVGPAEMKREVETGAPTAEEMAEWMAREDLPAGRIAAAIAKLYGVGRAEAYEIAQTARRRGGKRG